MIGLPWPHLCDCDYAQVIVKMNVMWCVDCSIVIDQKGISEELVCEFRSKCWKLGVEGVAV